MNKANFETFDEREMFTYRRSKQFVYFIIENFHQNVEIIPFNRNHKHCMHGMPALASNSIFAYF